MARPLILFAHGAGAPSTSEWMQHWATRLSTFGRVAPFDYPYMSEGRKRPDRQPVLIDAHRTVLKALRAHHDGPIVLAGKSMGSRIGCHVALQEQVDALVCFGYPLCSIGKKAKIRDEVLLALRTPILFCQGTKDSMSPAEVWAEVRPKMKADNEMFVVEGGRHGLEVGKRQLKAEGRTQDDVDDQILGAIRAFLERVL